MDFKDELQTLVEKVRKMRDTVRTEEATKNAFILPMIASLGYDVFNPEEVVPEMDCDLGKKGDKIDYAILVNGEPILLIECKQCNVELENCIAQLSKYYAASNARFGILTNGIRYMFFADLDKSNIMDEKPFLDLNFLDLSDTDIEQLKKFHKSYYNANDIISTAQTLKYHTGIKSNLERELSDPSPEFVSFIAKSTYGGRMTQCAIDILTPIVKDCIGMVINDTIKDRLSRVSSSQTVEPAAETAQDTDSDNGIVTTQEEVDAYNIIRSILREEIDASRVTFKDCKTYAVVSLDNSSRWICRLSLGIRKKAIGFPTENYKSNEWLYINSIDEIFSLSDRLSASLAIARKAIGENVN